MSQAIALTPEAAAALLRELEAAHGPSVLAALLGAAASADVADATAEAEAEGDDLPSFDAEWAFAFVEHPAFFAALSEQARIAFAAV